MPPSAAGTVIDGLANLPDAGGHYGSFGFVEIKALGVPWQAEEVDQAAALAFLVGDHFFVLDLQHLQRQDAEPVVGEPIDRQVSTAAIR